MQWRDTQRLNKHTILLREDTLFGAFLLLVSHISPLLIWFWDSSEPHCVPASNVLLTTTQTYWERSRLWRSRNANAPSTKDELKAICDFSKVKNKLILLLNSQKANTFSLLVRFRHTSFLYIVVGDNLSSIPFCWKLSSSQADFTPFDSTCCSFHAPAATSIRFLLSSYTNDLVSFSHRSSI